MPAVRFARCPDKRAVVTWLDGSGVCGESTETSSGVGRVIKSDDPCLVPNGGTKVFRNTTDRAIPMTIVEVLHRMNH